MATPITLIKGDGTGPELAAVTARVIDATGLEIDWRICEAGVDVMEEQGTPLPEATLASIQETGIALKAPITTPVGTGFRSVNVHLRKQFELYACVRPCRSYQGVRSNFENIDLVVIRENTEDLYAGIEYEEGTELCSTVIETLNGMGEHSPIRPDSGISIKPISRTGSERIVRYAFEYARANGRRKVTAVHKSNILKFTDGLFLKVAREVAEDYDDIEFEDRIVDNMCMQLVQKPELYDVMVLPNLYGDIISDLCAGMVGGLGVAPGGNIGAGDIAIFEATHGSAPKYAGQDKVNPTALILTGALMLRHMGETAAGERIEDAVAQVIAEGERVTYDLKPHRDDPGAVGTSEMAAAIIDAMGASVAS